MKVLLCSHTGVFRGGAERSLLLLAEKLKYNNIDYTINIPDGETELIKEIVKKDLNYITIYKDSDKSSLDSLTYLSIVFKFLKRFIYIFKMYKYMKNNNIDYVYLNTLRTTSEYMASKFVGIKSVMHLRGFDTSSNFRFRLLKNIDRFIVLNSSAKRIVSEKVSDSKVENILLIPNGVKLKNFQEKSFSQQKIKIVFIGGYEYRKGADYFLNISDQLLKLNKNIQIIHIGEPNPKDEFSKKLFEKYVTLFEHENYIEHGFSNNVSDDIAEADIFLMTSRIEGMPRSLLEAMERGLIPIVSNIEELQDIINEGENGFFINLNDLSESVKKINKVCTDIEDFKYISRNARNTVELKYDINMTNQKIIDALIKWDDSK